MWLRIQPTRGKLELLKRDWREELYEGVHEELMAFLRSDRFVQWIPKVNTIVLSCHERKSKRKKLIPLFETALETIYAQKASKVSVEVTDCPEMTRQDHTRINNILDQYGVIIEQVKYKVTKKPLSDAPVPPNEMLQLSHKVNHIILEGDLWLLDFFKVFTFHPDCKVNAIEMIHSPRYKKVLRFRQGMDELLTQFPNNPSETLRSLVLKGVYLAVSENTDLSAWSLPNLRLLELDDVIVRGRSPLQANNGPTLCGSDATVVTVKPGAVTSGLSQYIKFADGAKVDDAFMNDKGQKTKQFRPFVMGEKLNAFHAALERDEEMRKQKQKEKLRIKGLGGLEILEGEEVDNEPLHVRNNNNEEYWVRYCSRGSHYAKVTKFTKKVDGSYSKVCFGCDKPNVVTNAQATRYSQTVSGSANPLSADQELVQTSGTGSSSTQFSQNASASAN